MIFLFSLIISGVSKVNPAYIRRVEQLMAFHQFWQAYTELNQLISNEGKSVENSLYKLRGNCCLNMGMTKEVIEDGKNILSNKPSSDDKRYANTLLAHAYMQNGDFKRAEEAAKYAGDRNMQNNAKSLQSLEQKANSYYNQGKYSEAIQAYDVLIQNAPKCSDFILKRADIAWTAQDFGKYQELADSLSDELKNDGKILYRTGICLFCDGKIDDALQRVTKSKSSKNPPGTTTAAHKAITDFRKHYTLARKYLDQQKPKDAEIEINASYTSGQQFCSAGTNLINSLDLLRLRLLKIQKGPKELLEILNKMIDESPDSLDLVLERADLNLELEDYDAALFDYSNVQRHRPTDQRAADGINKAQELKKKKSYIDYYEILEIPKGSDESVVKDAYKKMVRKWHPDRYSDKTKKKEAEEKMKMINIAFDVLGDPQKKQLYDAGRDPDDPMGGAQNFGFNPFDLFFGGGGFNFGGGGGQQFHFNGGQGFHFEFHF
ncbi:DnaJ domain containing protein [Histomonas meleagridis]|uniref:DnaJ domain containing protein n=1 Tax=Histomonas meleagridis TaxID=135588 RepID=UPI003559A798|nr:DnaJ domain containing protein [Histomonas meleagridis]KAH0805926.1 DnaJ domain containing protein [Histomonas meleagridis]